MPLPFAARLTRPRLIILAAVLAIAGLLIAVAGQTGPAHAATGRAAQASAASWNSGPKPVIVLVHGAWADGSSWDQVVRNLQADGYTVYVPPNPLRGVTADSAYLNDFLTQNTNLTGKLVVLVGTPTAALSSPTPPSVTPRSRPWSTSTPSSQPRATR
jgi:pimeloyl-ACP methyl ester carboxylesterase